MTTFSDTDLIQYLYGECTNTKAKAIGFALQNNYSLQEKFAELKAGMQKINKVKLRTPRAQIIDNILAYAKKAVAVDCKHSS